MLKLARICVVLPLCIFLRIVLVATPTYATIKPTVQLMIVSFLENKMITIGTNIKKLTLTARVELEGLQFQWNLDGQGEYEIEPTSRKFYYIVPEHLNTELLEDQQHGVFTYYLTEGLKGEADEDQDGFITIQEIGNYITTRIPVTADKHKMSQHPQVQGNLNDSFPLVAIKF